MSAARDAIFAGIGRALGRGSGELPPPGERSTTPIAQLQPRLKKETVPFFIEKLEAAAGTLSRADTLSGVPQAVTDYLGERGLAQTLVLAGHPLLRDLEWPAGWETRVGAATAADHVSVCAAFAGVAETGTLVLLSGADSPTTLNFLPDDHIVVLRTTQIVDHFEDLWRLLRDNHRTMPRTVNLITGPSRTADVEQTIQLGAHGPRRLHAVLVED